MKKVPKSQRIFSVNQETIKPTQGIIRPHWEVPMPADEQTGETWKSVYRYETTTVWNPNGTATVYSSDPVWMGLKRDQNGIGYA